jgi:hypothetical protein
VSFESRKGALAAGSNDFLTKPLDRTEVLLRVRNLLITWSLYNRVHQHNEWLRRTRDIVRLDQGLTGSIDTDAASAPPYSLRKARWRTRSSEGRTRDGGTVLV